MATSPTSTTKRPPPPVPAKPYHLTVAAASFKSPRCEDYTGPRYGTRIRASDWHGGPRHPLGAFSKRVRSAERLDIPVLGGHTALVELLKGCYPYEMEHRWFCWCTGCEWILGREHEGAGGGDCLAVLHVHHSWTGAKIAEVEVWVDIRAVGWEDEETEKTEVLCEGKKRGGDDDDDIGDAPSVVAYLRHFTWEGDVEKMESVGLVEVAGEQRMKLLALAAIKYGIEVELGEKGEGGKEEEKR